MMRAVRRVGAEIPEGLRPSGLFVQAGATELLIGDWRARDPNPGENIIQLRYLRRF